ncbi:MAG: hypothetical protein JSR17_12735 [Proteobacteria bacterium]|nr:hypothetical protein [Pseudomonadota bacterium]
MLTLPTVTFKSKEETDKEKSAEIARQFVVVNGMCLYKSSGHNSGEASTWFPNLGVITQGHPLSVSAYVMRNYENMVAKPFLLLDAVPKFPPEMLEMQRCFNYDSKKTKDVWDRFGSVAGMLVSSKLGGGLWDTPAGKEFKSYLEKNHGEFYQNFPAMQLSGIPREISQENQAQLNDWIAKNGGKLDDIHKDLKTFISEAKTLKRSSGISFSSQHPASRSKPEATPSQAQALDPITEANKKILELLEGRYKKLNDKHDRRSEAIALIIEKIKNDYIPANKLIDRKELESIENKIRADLVTKGDMQKLEHFDKEISRETTGSVKKLLGKNSEHEVLKEKIDKIANGVQESIREKRTISPRRA